VNGCNGKKELCCIQLRTFMREIATRIDKDEQIPLLENTPFDIVVQRDDNQVPQVGTTVHRKLLPTPHENFVVTI